MFLFQNEPSVGKSEAVGSLFCFILTIAFSSLKKHAPDLILTSERFVSLCLTSTFLPPVNVQAFQAKLRMTMGQEEKRLIFSLYLESLLHFQNGLHHLGLPCATFY